jgi:hypothetical protein
MPQETRGLKKWFKNNVLDEHTLGADRWIDRQMDIPSFQPPRLIRFRV